ncbi:hypothetical protein CC2G_006915 [Coprinopsis cinerea AmutBmut pab1-1]|nr:hypothetical protein CC2G_006915 [Coprinopsis cinerea AmutBmut pab1-1]
MPLLLPFCRFQDSPASKLLKDVTPAGNPPAKRPAKPGTVALAKHSVYKVDATGLSQPS